MQPTNQRKSQQSRCIYCGSTTRGKGCRYAPHGVHFHPDDSTKCAYCGSSCYGKGCKTNPISDLHVHGVSYNNMYKEQVQSFLDHHVLLNELKKDFCEFECYKLGIIDNNGNKLKSPVTEQEQMSYSPMTKTILKLKKYLGSKIELIEAVGLLEHKSLLIEENIEHYKKVLSYQDKVQTLINELYKTLDEARQDGLIQEDVSKLLKA